MIDYDLLEKIGSGSYGDVYRAFDKKKKLYRAVKKFKKEYSSISECKNEKEVEILTKLKHQNIISLKKVVYEKKRLFMIMDLGTENLGQIFQNRVT